jgi:hypothetical protein
MEGLEHSSVGDDTKNRVITKRKERNEASQICVWA